MVRTNLRLQLHVGSFSSMYTTRFRKDEIRFKTYILGKIGVSNLVKVLPVKSKQPTPDKLAILHKRKYEIFSQCLVRK